METHHLRLTAEPFAAIRAGRKTIESRLYDERRRQIKLSDELVFIHREDDSQVIHARVVGLLRYDSFAEMFSRNNPGRFGLSSSDQLLAQVAQFYNDADERQHGVLGIEFKLV